MSTSEQRSHFVYSSGSPYRQRSHWSLLHFGTEGRRFFPRVAATMNSTYVITKCQNKWYHYVRDCTDWDIFTNKNCNFISPQHNTRKNSGKFNNKRTPIYIQNSIMSPIYNKVPKQGPKFTTEPPIYNQT